MASAMIRAERLIGTWTRFGALEPLDESSKQARCCRMATR